MGQPGLVVVFYNAVLSRLHESVLKKTMALAALPGGWLAAGVVAFAGLSGHAPAWFLFDGHGAGDFLLSLYLCGSAVGGAAVLGLIAFNPRRKLRPREEWSNHSRIVSVPRRSPWPYGPGKRAFLSLTAPINELTDIEVAIKEVELPNLPPEFDGLRIAHVTDFHIDRALEDEYFRAAVRIVNEQSPDIVALTGDFISRVPNIDRIPALMGGFRAREGVYFVRGNHDFWTRPEEVRNRVESLGYVCLDNRAEILRRGGGREENRMEGGDGAAIALVGIEHPYGRRIRRWDEMFRPDWPPCRIVLMHTPDIIGPVSRMGCDLALAGHTHGGQVQFPVVGATLVPSSYGRRYASGWKRVGRTLLYTNRGLGAFFPLRFLCRPEIAVFVLRAPRKAESTSGVSKRNRNPGTVPA